MAVGLWAPSQIKRSVSACSCVRLSSYRHWHGPPNSSDESWLATSALFFSLVSSACAWEPERPLEFWCKMSHYTCPWRVFPFPSCMLRTVEDQTLHECTRRYIVPLITRVPGLQAVVGGCSVKVLQSSSICWLSYFFSEIEAKHFESFMVQRGQQGTDEIRHCRKAFWTFKSLRCRKATSNFVTLRHPCRIIAESSHLLKGAMQLCSDALPTGLSMWTAKPIGIFRTEMPRRTCWIILF